MLNVSNPALEKDLKALRDKEFRDAETWRSKATKELKKLAMTKPNIVSDDLREALEHSDSLPFNPAALGSAFLRAERDGLIKHSGYYVPSRRNDAHKRPIAVWRSLIYVETIQ